MRGKDLARPMVLDRQQEGLAGGEASVIHPSPPLVSALGDLTAEQVVHQVGDECVAVGFAPGDLGRVRLGVERALADDPAFAQQPFERLDPVAQHIDLGGERHDHAEGAVERLVLEECLLGFRFAHPTALWQK